MACCHCTASRACRSTRASNVCRFGRGRSFTFSAFFAVFAVPSLSRIRVKKTTCALLRDRLHRDADLDVIPDEEAARFERRVPVQTEIFSVDGDVGFESDARVAPGILRGA